MSQSANVGSVEALTDLRVSLTRYAEEAGSALAGAAREIAATKAWLEERLAYWQAVVRRCADEVADISAELRACYEAEDAYCGHLERALREAQARLRAAQEELATVRRWFAAIAEAAQAYDREARALGVLLSRDVPHAAATLDGRIAALQQYAALGLGPGGGAGFADAMVTGLVGGTQARSHSARRP